MLKTIAVVAAAAIFAAPVCAATGGGGAAGGNSAGGGSAAGVGGHSGGGGGSSSSAGHGGGSAGGVGHGGGLSGSAAAAAARSAIDGRDSSLRAGMSHADPMHLTHLAGGKRAAGEHATSSSPGMHHHRHPYRREPGYGTPIDELNTLDCLPAADLDTESWFTCNKPTKSLPRGKS